MNVVKKIQLRTNDRLELNIKSENLCFKQCHQKLLQRSYYDSTINETVYECSHVVPTFQMNIEFNPMFIDKDPNIDIKKNYKNHCWCDFKCHKNAET